MTTHLCKTFLFLFFSSQKTYFYLIQFEAEEMDSLGMNSKKGLRRLTV